MTQYRTNYLINDIDKFKIRNLTRKSSTDKLTLKSLKFSSKITKLLSVALVNLKFFLIL